MSRECRGVFRASFAHLVAQLRAGGAIIPQEADGMNEAAEGRKRQRAVMATDSDWQALKERADAVGMDVSRFIMERLTAPVAVPEDVDLRRDLAGAVARIERMVRVLYEVEKERVEGSAGADTWQALVRRAGARSDAEEAIG